MTKLWTAARASTDLASTGSRSAKTTRLARLLAESEIDDVPALVAWLSGELLQRRIGVGWASLSSLPAPAAEPTLDVSFVDQTFADLATVEGEGSHGKRAALLHTLMSAATSEEQAFLRAVISGALRQGALGGVMIEAVARAARVPSALVRRALMLVGDLPTVADAAFRGGAAALEALRLQVGRALAPMLAQSARSVEEVLQTLPGAVAFEAKLDGARIQVHKDGDQVRLFTRSLDDLTARLPSVVAEVRSWSARSLVADGEILAMVGARPMAFQETASRVARGTTEGDVGAAEQDTLRWPPESLRVFLFDLLHRDGEDLLDRPARERRAALEAIALGRTKLVERLVSRDATEARDFFERMLQQGYEGVVAKALDAPYEAGRRGASWLKVKPVFTLDLVVLAVEQGSGRRRGKLSNIHLGARDPDGGFVMLGKTFKGMTDAMLAWQTERFRELADGPLDGYVVKLRPEQVVEVAFDGVQVSSRYPGKVALRFARVVRYRSDKTAAEADTLDAVRAVLARGRS